MEKRGDARDVFRPQLAARLELQMLCRNIHVGTGFSYVFEVLAFLVSLLVYTPLLRLRTWLGTANSSDTSIFEE